MSKKNDHCSLPPVQTPDPLGIIVREGSVSRTLPRAVAFVWGGEVLPAPSLPFGRWKAGALSPA